MCFNYGMLALSIRILIKVNEVFFYSLTHSNLQAK